MVKLSFPDLYKVLQETTVINMIGISWFLTLFISAFRLPNCVRIPDCFFYDGPRGMCGSTVQALAIVGGFGGGRSNDTNMASPAFTVLFQVGLTILKFNHDELIELSDGMLHFVCLHTYISRALESLGIHAFIGLCAKKSVVCRGRHHCSS